MTSSSQEKRQEIHSEITLQLFVQAVLWIVDGGISRRWFMEVLVSYRRSAMTQNC